MLKRGIRWYARPGEKYSHLHRYEADLPYSNMPNDPFPWPICKYDEDGDGPATWNYKNKSYVRPISYTGNIITRCNECMLRFEELIQETVFDKFPDLYMQEMLAAEEEG